VPRLQDSRVMDPLVALYTRIMRPLLFRLDAETAHRMTLMFLAGVPIAIRPSDPVELRQTLWGMEFANPIGLAAGMDKDVQAPGAWQAMGFGFVEFGTVTPRPQPGNPPPRMWRIEEHRALVNRLGFPSAGMEAAAHRLGSLRPRGLRIRVGVNIGPNRDTPPGRVAEDCATLMRALSPSADFVVVNLSSPNTPGLREWQAPERMREVFGALAAAQEGTARHPPILVKLSPDIDAAMLPRICDEALALKLHGIVATNTTVAREEVGVACEHPGGLSGRPLWERARAVIRDIYRHTGGRIPIIGVGGVASAEDAYGHIRAGASAVELYTGLVYRGPGLVGAIKTGMTRLLKRDGIRSIGEAVGRDA
jgi:dihydroorotate dehydrogenase